MIEGLSTLDNKKASFGPAKRSSSQPAHAEHEEFTGSLMQRKDVKEKIIRDLTRN